MKGKNYQAFHTPLMTYNILLTRFVVKHSVAVVSLNPVGLFRRPHGLQPARLLCSWDFLGNNTGVGCHFLLQETLLKFKRKSIFWWFNNHIVPSYTCRVSNNASQSKCSGEKKNLLKAWHSTLNISYIGATLLIFWNSTIKIYNQ